MSTYTLPTHRSDLYINGLWSKSQGSSRSVENPATASDFGSVPEATEDEVNSAIDAASQAFPSWAQTAKTDRAHLLRELANVLESRSGAFIDVISGELGAPRKLAEQLHLGLPITVLRTTADLLEDYSFESQVGNSTIYREPIGVVAAITPWNYPLHQITAKIVPALAAGCTIVLKPADLTPLTAFAFADAIDEAGFPPGVFNLVSGPGAVVGDILALHPDIDMMSFTGSVDVGRTVMRSAASTIKRVSLELGGKSASLIAEDVSGDELTKAVKVSVANAFLNSGQTCSAWTRLIVPGSRYDEIAALASAAAEKYVPGDRIGPMISSRQRERVLEYMKGAEDQRFDIVAGGIEGQDIPDTGWYITPTIYGKVSPNSALAQEEIFGPVLAILTYESEDEAIAIANGTNFGLSGAVWAGDDDHATALARSIRTGQVDINGGSFNPLAPFGGYKQSGNGRELGAAGIEEFCELKAVQR